MTLKDRFAKYKDQYQRFDLEPNPLFTRPETVAFWMLTTLQPSTERKNLIASIGYEMLFLDIDCEKLNSVITDEQIQTLVRCGINCTSDDLILKIQ